MKKNFITGIVVGGMLFGGAGALAGYYTAVENPFPIQLNGANVSLEGYNINDNTYFKLRDIADAVGGFTVGFENNTIQLAKDGYTYQSVDIAIPERIDSVTYYDIPSWCPDFGAYTGATLKQHGDSGMYIYDASESDLNKYFELLYALGYQKGTLPRLGSEVVFVQGDCSISFTSIFDTYVSMVGVFAASGDWVQSEFVPDNQSVNIASTSIAYYSDIAWCPDFGAYTGITTYTHSKPGTYTYNATPQDVEKYVKLLYSLGYSKGTMPNAYLSTECDIFAYEDYCIYITKNSDGSTGIVANNAGWVSDEFVPES